MADYYDTMILQRNAPECAALFADECRKLRVQQDTLHKALEKIRDGDIDCNCDHSNEFCCANVDEYCPFCIAAVALAKEYPTK